MNPFRHAYSTREQWDAAARDCLDALQPVPAEARLGFIYASDHFADRLANILVLCRERTGIAHWVGSVGVGIAATGHEFMDRPALAMMLAELPEDAFRILPGIDGPAGLAAHQDCFSVAGQPAYFGVVHGDPDNPDIAGLIGQAAERTQTGFLVGGLTSSRGPHSQVADQVLSGGLSGVLFSAEVTVATRLTQGVSPMGRRHVVTACEHNVILGLDDRPPLDVLREDVGETLAANLDRLGGYIFVGLPNRDSDTGDYLVRQLLGVDPDSKFIAVGDYPEKGQSLMFCRRDGKAAVRDMQRMLDDLKAGLPGPPRGALYYSCLGRGASLFGTESEELRMIGRTLGDIPLVGFFANGEISRNRLYGWTGVLTVFC